MGKCLFDSQFIEEEIAAKGIEKPTYCKEFISIVEITDQHIKQDEIVYSNNKTLLLSHPVADITTPPPNTFLG